MKFTIKKISFIILFLPLLLNISHAQSSPYIPDSGDEVLILLEKTSQRSKFENINTQLTQNSDNPSQLISILQQTINYGKVMSDPRYIGYASAFVDNYLATNTNLEFKVLKASILQHDHKFNEAIDILNDVIKTNPVQSNARLLRASVLQVQAKYSQARKDCYSLLGKASHLITIACIAQVDGLTKNTQRNYNALKNILNRNNKSYSTDELSWSYDILAQLAMQLGDSIQAEQHYKQGLSISADNTALLNAYADLLINQKRYKEVTKILKNKQQDFTVLLRLAIAEKLSSTGDTYKSQFRSRMNKMQATADLTHQREISAYYLYVEKNSQKALAYAIDNWQVQKELYDALLLLHCARENKSINTAQAVINWYTDNSISDTRLNKIIKEIKQQNWS